MTHQPRRFNLDRLDRAMSAMARSLNSPVPKECFLNAFRAFPLMLHHGATLYVEGYAALEQAPIMTPHGWLEASGGRIIECTVEHYQAYYPVQTYSFKEMMREAEETMALPLLDFEFGIGRHGQQLRFTYNDAMKQEYGVDFDLLKSYIKEVDRGR
jgi:hypothetical protein